MIYGKTDQSQYMLSGKLTVIGKSDMASIKLKGWFKPKVAAVINHRDGKYFIAASERDIKVKINDELIAGQHELSDGDVVEVAGVKMTFGFERVTADKTRPRIFAEEHGFIRIPFDP